MVTASSTGTATTWKIDPSHSLVEYSTKHMMVTTVKGRFSTVSGTITLDGSNPANSSVDAEIEVASIVSGDEKRDGHLRSPDFFDADNHPKLTFKSTRVEAASTDHVKVYGDLTIRGTTRQVVLDTEMTGQGKTPYGVEVAGFTATTTINRKDFGLNWNVALEAGGFLVGDTVKVTLEIEASKVV